MNEEGLKQRISYLVEHGGVYPERRPRWVKWVAALIGLDLITLGAVLLM